MANRPREKKVVVIEGALDVRSDIAEFDGSVWIINPDLLTRRLQASEGLDLQAANFAAVTRMETWLDASIDVLRRSGSRPSSPRRKYRPLVLKAKKRGFDVRFVYTYVDTLERQLERVRIRVAKGGHDVPAEKVAARRSRSFDEFPWFFWEAHQALVYDNSGHEPRLVAWKEQIGLAELSADLLPELHAGVMQPHEYR